eukprot:6213997-Pleurochrysis_carterae.AAC.1
MLCSRNLHRLHMLGRVSQQVAEGRRYLRHQPKGALVHDVSIGALLRRVGFFLCAIDTGTGTQDKSSLVVHAK